MADLTASGFARAAEFLRTEARPIDCARFRHHFEEAPASAVLDELARRRGAVERLFSRGKLHRRLGSITVRGLNRVTAHCYMPLIVMNAMALAMQETPRQVVRAAA